MHLGISAFYHDSAAAIVDRQGNIVAAAQEERFTRRRHDAAWPREAIEYCLAAAQITGEELDSVTFYEKPLLKFNRIVDGYVTLGESGYRAFEDSLPKWFNGKLNQADLISGLLRDSAPNVDWDTKLKFIEHHLSHAASAFYPSHFEKAAVLTLDGVGEYATVTVSKGDKASLIIDRQIDYPDSLGLLYSAFTYYTGFKVNSGEYKMMGLAPYGKPRFKDFILENILSLNDDYSFSVDQEYFDSFAGEVIINKGFEELFKRPKRSSKEPIDQFYMDVAASAQKATEEAIIHLAKGIRLEGYSENLCLAGGVALNCVANARMRRECGFSDVWVQPAAGDAGGALGAALYTLHNEFGVERPETNVDRMHGAYLGPMLAVEQVKEQLDKDGASFDIFDEDELIDRAAKALASGKTLAWHQGRMEFGPRALGARSILADPRDPEMQKRLNLEVKKRESFRPFAPAILEEDVGDWFQDGLESPYMLFTDTLIESQRGEDPDSDSQGFDRLKELSCSVPAITHVDWSARVQTVSEATNPRFHKLLTRFKELTGCPILVNTSFNVRGEPIVNTASNAYRTFLNTDLDCLVVWPAWVVQEEQNPINRMRFQQSFPED